MSMGGGKGGSSSSTSSKPSKQLMAIIEPLMAAAMPVVQSFFGQALEAMRTGGTMAKIPLIQQSVQQSKAATSRALAQTSSSLGSQRGTPFGQQVLANTRLAGETNTGQIPVRIAEQMASMGADKGLTATGQGIGGLAGTGTKTTETTGGSSAGPGGILQSMFGMGAKLAPLFLGPAAAPAAAAGGGFDMDNLLSTIGLMTGGTGID